MVRMCQKVKVWWLGKVHNRWTTGPRANQSLKERQFQYHKEGHYMRDYLKLRKRKEALANIGVSSSVFVDSLEGDDSSIRKVLCVSVRQREDSWILDSGATFHMCPHKTLFVEHKQLSRTVYLWDGS